MRTGRWYLKFAFDCLAVGFGGWLLLAVVCVPLFRYWRFDDPYRQLIGGLMTVASIHVASPAVVIPAGFGWNLQHADVKRFDAFAG